MGDPMGSFPKWARVRTKSVQRLVLICGASLSVPVSLVTFYVSPLGWLRCYKIYGYIYIYGAMYRKLELTDPYDGDGNLMLVVKTNVDDSRWVAKATTNGEFFWKRTNRMGRKKNKSKSVSPFLLVYLFVFFFPPQTNHPHLSNI